MDITADWISAKLVGYGVPAADARIMAAVAYGESGYRHDAENISSIEHSIGLFQINTNAHYDKLQRWTGSSEQSVWDSYLKEPDRNVFAASEVYKSQGLGAWTVYSNGSYRSYLDNTEVVSGGSVSAAGSVIDGDLPVFVSGVISNPLVWLLVLVVLIIRR